MIFNKYFWKDASVIALSPLQIAEGMADGLKELTEAEKQALLAPSFVEPPIKDFKHFTGRDKQGIFTDAEKRAIYTAAYINPDIDVLMLVKEMDNAGYVTYSDQSMVQGLEILEAKGLITPERHQEIIAAMTAEREV